MNEIPRIIIRISTIEDMQTNLLFYSITIVSYTKIKESCLPLFVNKFIGVNEQPLSVMSKIDMAIGNYVRDLIKSMK
jgi:hypothetical protein